MHKFKKPFIICHREGEGKGRCRRILKEAEMVFRGIKWFSGVSNGFQGGKKWGIKWPSGGIGGLVIANRV